MEGVTSWGESEALLGTLNRRGWCFRDPAQIKALISLQFVLHGDSLAVDSVEPELANMDFRSIGGKLLPDISLLRNSTHLAGPKVLQAISIPLARSQFSLYVDLRTREALEYKYLRSNLLKLLGTIGLPTGSGDGVREWKSGENY